MDILQQLRDLGLFVRSHLHRDGCRVDYFIYQPLAGYTIEEMSVPGDEDITFLKNVKMALIIFAHDHDWWLCRYDNDFGTGPEDFSKSYDSEDEALDAVLEYFTGEPTIIDGWIVPIHRHPQLGEEQALSAIQSPQKIPDSEYRTIEGSYLSRLEALKKGEDDPLKYLFLAVPHQTDEQFVLYLRRDGQEAFVVEKG